MMYNGTEYYYVKNLQGDIIGIIDNQSNTVSGYQYDSWGKLLKITGNQELGKLNPFRYRGYYYDNETGLYYLNSRYYDPEVGRFVSADDLAVLDVKGNLYDKNLFAYCDNNPIVRVDDTGRFWDTVFDVISLGASIAEVVVNPADPWAWAGLAGDTVDLIPFITGVGEVTKTVKLTVKASGKSGDAVKAARKIYNSAGTSNGIRKMTGSYEIIYKSKKNYVGKGGFKRAIKSAGEHLNSQDKVASITWYSAKNSRDAFINEYKMMCRNGLDKNLTFNKICSPGRKYYLTSLSKLYNRR